MGLSFEPVTTADGRMRLAALADEIWHEYWPALIGAAQTDYMVEQFQSLEAIERDMAEAAYEYWLLRDNEDGRLVGYTGGHVEPETNRFFVSKIYLRAPGARTRVRQRDRALLRGPVPHARALRAVPDGQQAQRPAPSALTAPKASSTIDAVETDIGNGFVMDDFIMEKRVD